MYTTPKSVHFYEYEFVSRIKMISNNEITTFYYYKILSHMTLIHSGAAGPR